MTQRWFKVQNFSISMHDLYVHIFVNFFIGKNWTAICVQLIALFFARKYMSRLSGQWICTARTRQKISGHYPRQKWNYKIYNIIEIVIICFLKVWIFCLYKKEYFTNKTFTMPRYSKQNLQRYLNRYHIRK